MIYLQTRREAAWQNVHSFTKVNPSQIDTVRRSNLQARLWDRARDRVIVESLPAKGIPIQGLKPADVELALATFG